MPTRHSGTHAQAIHRRCSSLRLSISFLIVLNGDDPASLMHWRRHVPAQTTSPSPSGEIDHRRPDSPSFVCYQTRAAPRFSPDDLGAH